MRQVRILVGLVLTLAMGVRGAAAEGGVTAPGAVLEKLSGEFAFTEGATCDPAGNVYFTDQPNDRIMKWSLDSKHSVFMKPCNRCNGMMFDSKGNLYACADEKNELWLITPQKKATVLVKGYKGKLLNAPNDVWLRPGGGLYFTDPWYKRDWWKHATPPQEVEGVYFLSEPGPVNPVRREAGSAPHSNGTGVTDAGSEKTNTKTASTTAGQLVRVIDDLKRPNGITGTPDGKTLYVADLDAQKTYAYDIRPDGSLANKRLFCQMGSDGMTIDSEGNVYLTGNGVTVFDKTGKQIDHIDVPESWSANVCFGGKDRKTLFITASKGLYAVKMRVKGVDGKGGK